MSLRKLFILLLSTWMLSSCGSSGVQVADGIGGTGITMGRISGFGSVVVNGERYDTTGATFIRDRVEGKQQGDFNVGELVYLKGQFDNTSAQASEVIFSDVIQGTITALFLDIDNPYIEILSQKVTISADTLVHGVAAFEDLQLGNFVEVSGFVLADGTIRGLTINYLAPVLPANEIVELDGEIQLLNINNKTFSINGLEINYANAMLTNITEDQMANGMKITVNSTQNQVNNVLIADEVISEVLPISEGAKLTIDGEISELNGSIPVVNDVPLIITPNTVFDEGQIADLVVGSEVDAVGILNAQGELIVETIEVETFDREIVLEGFIQQLDPVNSTIQLLDLVVTTDQKTIFDDVSITDLETFGFTDLVVNDFVEVVASQKANVNKAILIKRKNAQQDVEFRSAVEALQTAENENFAVNVSGLRIELTENIILRGGAGRVITPEVFITRITRERRFVTVKGEYQGATFIVNEIQIIRRNQDDDLEDAAQTDNAEET